MINIVTNKTKIVATIGPASNTKEMLRQLIIAGVDVFRLNFSHGVHEDHRKVISLVRELNAELGTMISLLQDLQGPKIRVNEMEPNIVIAPGDEITITTHKVIGNATLISTSYQHLPKDVKPGDPLMIDDGKIELKAIKSSGDNVLCKVVYGGLLKSKKGINLPKTNVSAPSLTEKDMEDLRFGMQHRMDWIALSFVRTAEDIFSMREILKANNSSARIMAKIERPEAIKNIDSIIDAADGVMVARGDLGVEIQMEEVPLAQKMIIEKCNQMAKPVIVATQMMESMIENPRPTRAETNDVANAVLDGADALMLSGETAAGKYPVEVINCMVHTIEAVEDTGKIFYRYRDVDLNSARAITDSVILTACKLAKEIKAKAIVGMTQAGYNIYRASSHRPDAKLFAFTHAEDAINSINLVWGAKAVYYDQTTSTDETISDVEKILVDSGELKTGDIFIFLASMPILQRGLTNMLKVHRVK
ncbi:MAG: pyruvate kinase [Candidatus Nephrothrix sp. EaCA]|nr:MAG: pyruvate kinase [Candidatus Nephrothrix sp. EaCA]